MKEWRGVKVFWGGCLGGQVPRLYGGTIFRGVRHPRGVWQAFESKGSAFENLCPIFLTPQISEFWPINWHRCVTICNLKYCIFKFFFYGSGLRAMAIRKICRFWADRQIIDLRHEGSTILMQCNLGICRGPFYLPKTTFQEFVVINSFLMIGRDVKFCEIFSMGRCASCAWVVRSKLIWVVNLIIV